MASPDPRALDPRRDAEHCPDQPLGERRELAGDGGQVPEAGEVRIADAHVFEALQAAEGVELGGGLHEGGNGGERGAQVVGSAPAAGVAVDAQERLGVPRVLQEDLAEKGAPGEEGRQTLGKARPLEERPHRGRPLGQAVEVAREAPERPFGARRAEGRRVDGVVQVLRAHAVPRGQRTDPREVPRGGRGAGRYAVCGGRVVGHRARSPCGAGRACKARLRAHP